MIWMKLYGGEFLKDPKILSLTSLERMCWVTLLCFACDIDLQGEIPHITEEVVMMTSGITPGTEEWDDTAGVFNKFQETSMITLGNASVTITNWKKRQCKPMSSYERVKKHRSKKGSDDNDVPLSSISKSLEYIKKVPQKDVDEFVARFVATEAEVRGKAEDLLNWCKANGKRKSNYRSFLLMALREDFKERKDGETKYENL